MTPLTITNTEILKHDAEDEVYRYTLDQPEAFRSRVSVSRTLRATKTAFMVQTNLRVTDLTSDTLVVMRVPGEGARYTLAAMHGQVAYPLLEGSPLAPDALAALAGMFRSPDDATPKPAFVPRAPTPRTAAAPKRTEKQTARPPTLEPVDLNGLDGPDDHQGDSRDHIHDHIPEF